MPIVNKHDPKAIYKEFADRFPKLVLGACSYTYVGTGAIKLKYTDGRVCKFVYESPKSFFLEMRAK